MSNVKSEFETDLVENIPHLRAFARSFVKDAERADDLVQETLVKAWHAQRSFVPGTRLRAWLFTILRNTYYSEFRKRKHETEDPDEVQMAALSVGPNQLIGLQFSELNEAVSALPDDQREALILVGAEGFSYEEVARICNCAVGTIKSRVNRARNKLGKLLANEPVS